MFGLLSKETTTSISLEEIFLIPFVPFQFFHIILPRRKKESQPLDTHTHTHGWLCSLYTNHQQQFLTSVSMSQRFPWYSVCPCSFSQGICVGLTVTIGQNITHIMKSIRCLISLHSGTQSRSSYPFHKTHIHTYKQIMFTEQCLCYGSILFLKIGFLIFLQGGMAQWFCRYLPPKRTNLISPDTRFVGLSLLLNCAFSLKTCILYGGEKYIMRKTWVTILHWQRSTMNNQRNHRLDEKSSWIIKITKKKSGYGFLWN